MFCPSTHGVALQCSRPSYRLSRISRSYADSIVVPIVREGILGEKNYHRHAGNGNLPAASRASCAIAAPSAPDGILGWVYIRPTGAAKCLAIPNGSTTPNTAAILWQCNGGNEQKWYISGTGRSTLRYGKNYEMCLAIPGGSTVDGVRPIIWPCSTGTEQLWVGFAAQGTPIVNLRTQKCLDGYRWDENLILQWRCDQTRCKHGRSCGRQHLDRRLPRCPGPGRID